MFLKMLCRLHGFQGLRKWFLRVKAATAFSASYPSVRLSVRLSHGWISQKWCKLELPNFHCWLPGRL